MPEFDFDSLNTPKEEINEIVGESTSTKKEDKKPLKPSEIKEKIKTNSTKTEPIDTFGDLALPPPKTVVLSDITLPIIKPKIDKKPQPKISLKPKDNNQIIILLWGYDGTSKSEQILKFKPAPIVIDLENKLRPLAEKLKFPLDNIIVASEYNEQYQIHGPNTLKGIRDTLMQIRDKIKKGIKISAIALDGITDIRPYAVSEWLDENPNRKNPATAGDWGDINDKVREICFQMINIGRAEGISVFLTAQVGGVYEKNVRVKEVPDCKDWIWHNVDHKFKCYNENQKFYTFCEKSYLDPFWTIDLTDFTHTSKPSLMNILQDSKLLEKYKKEYIDSKQNIGLDVFGGK